MSRFLLRAGGFCVLQILVALAVLWLGADYGEHAANRDSYFLAMKDKVALLRGEGGSRIIFVGGSNVAFGIRGELFSDVLRRRPVNMGLHAGLGLGFPLRCVLADVREGDIVVVMPEYDLLVRRLDAYAECVAAMTSLWPEASRYLETTDGRAEETGLRVFLDREGFQLAHERVHSARRNLVRFCRESLRTRPRAVTQVSRGVHSTVYRRAGFNQYGDMVAHYGLPGKPLKASDGVGPLTSKHHECLNNAIQMLNDFCSVCREKGAEVYFSYPPMPDVVFERSRRGIREVHRRLRETLEIPIVTHPEQTSFPSGMFYDTVNHLSREGAHLRSEVVAQAISRHAVPRKARSMAAQRADPMY